MRAPMATTLPLTDADAASTVFYDMDASIKDSNMEYLVRPSSVALLPACSLGFGCAKEGGGQLWPVGRSVNWATPA